MIKANILGDKIPKESMLFTCIACITIDSAIKMMKEDYPQVYLKECKHRMKKKKVTKFIEAELESESESGLESYMELKLKSQ